MSKRFTDTSKWTNNKWFRSLPPAYKLFWLYLNDICDNVGIWYEDIEQAEFHTGMDIDKELALDLFNGRVQTFPNKRGDEVKWFVPEFCEFQYGDLSHDCAPHRSYITLLDKHGLWDGKNQRILKGYSKGTSTLKEKEKEKDKEKEKEKAKEYARGVKMAEEEYADLCERFGKQTIDVYVEKLSDYKRSTGKQYKDDAATIKTWMRRDKGVDSIAELEKKKIPTCAECGRDLVNIGDLRKCPRCGAAVPARASPVAAR